MFRVVTVTTLLALAISLATALEPFDNFREGSCSRSQVRPIKANREFIDSLRYVTAGSRYIIHSIAASLPNYSTVRDDELYYDGCYSRNTTTTVENSIGAIFGFGRPLVTFEVTTRPGIYLEGIPTDPALSSNHLIDTVTLTDYKSFAFIINCWTGVDQRSWGVVTRTPNSLDPNTIRIIEDHAVSLGFKRENFVFLRHDSCRQGLGNPALRIGRS